MGEKKLDERFLNTKRVSELLSVDIRTVQRWIKDGSLNAVQLGRNYLISQKDFEEFKAKNLIKV